MNAALFALISKDYDGVFAWGMEITVTDDPGADPGTSALVYRPPLNGDRSLISVHDSAEKARTAYCRVTPVVLEWDADLWHEADTKPFATMV